MTQEEALERTRAFVQQNFLYTRPGFQLGADDQLLGRGILDSMGVLELVEFLETEFGLAVLDDDITEANLGSLGAISRFVVTKC